MSAELYPGARVLVRQAIQRRTGFDTTEVTGIIVSVRREPTGSWYAHGKDDKLWLARLELRKDDGELTVLTIDQHTSITTLESAA